MLLKLMYNDGIVFIVLTSISWSPGRREMVIMNFKLVTSYLEDGVMGGAGE